MGDYVGALRERLSPTARRRPDCANTRHWRTSRKATLSQFELANILTLPERYGVQTGGDPMAARRATVKARNLAEGSGSALSR